MSRRFAFVIAAAALVIWFVVAFAARWQEPLGLDQGLFACFARWVPRGYLPYRDIFDSKPPLFLYSYALARLFPVEITHQIWILDGIWILAVVALAYRLAARAWGRWAGLAAAALIFFGEWAPGWGGYWARAQADEWVALPMLGAALAAWSDRPIWCGVLSGMAGLFKIPAMAIVVAWPFVWRSWKKFGWMMVGLALPWLLVAAWFAAHGALRDFVEGVFVYHRYNAELIAPPWSRVLPEFGKTMLVNAAPLLFLALIGALAEWRRLAPWILLTMAAVILERQLAGYQYLLAMPALALGGARGAVEIARRKSWPLTGVVLILAGIGGWQWWRGYSGAPNYDRPLFSPAVEAQAAEYLGAHSAPNEGVLIWGLAPGIYALADRHPVTRYPFHKILYTDAPLSQMIPGLDARRKELLEKMDRDPPRYVLVGRRDRNGFEPDDSFTSLQKWPALDDRLHRDYQPEAEIGRFIVLRRR